MTVNQLIKYLKKADKTGYGESEIIFCLPNSSKEFSVNEISGFSFISRLYITLMIKDDK